MLRAYFQTFNKIKAFIWNNKYLNKIARLLFTAQELKPSSNQVLYIPSCLLNNKFNSVSAMSIYKKHIWNWICLINLSEIALSQKFDRKKSWKRKKKKNWNFYMLYPSVVDTPNINILLKKTAWILIMSWIRWTHPVSSSHALYSWEHHESMHIDLIWKSLIAQHNRVWHKPAIRARDFRGFLSIT